MPHDLTLETPAAPALRELGPLQFQTRGSLGITLIHLGAVIGALGVTALLHAEGRVGDPVSFVLTLWYNPREAVPGLLVVVALGGALWSGLSLWRHLRARVEVRERGLRVFPGDRRVAWDRIAELCLAVRRLRHHGVPSSERRSLRLTTRDGEQIDLPHRFRRMEELVARVLDGAAPRLLEVAQGELNRRGACSFGDLLTVEKLGLRFGSGGDVTPWDRIQGCALHGGVLVVTDRDGRSLFSRGTEWIPNGPIVPRLVQIVRQSRHLGS